LKNPSQKRAGSVAQGIDPELKPQYCKKKKKSGWGREEWGAMSVNIEPVYRRESYGDDGDGCTEL
jgi:hypothetical protein